MELADADFAELAKVIHDLTGLVIGTDKAYLVRHRLEPVARNFGCETFEGFVGLLQTAPSTRMHDAVIDAITTKETSFFRDTWLFDAILKHVLPECAGRLSAPGAKRHRIRIWSAAAATGQEAYSLGMLVRELTEAAGSGVNASQFSVLASDISTTALETAKAGIYPAAEVSRSVSETRQRHHFVRAAKHLQVAEAVRNLVQFRRLNLLRPPSDLGAFDLVLCRNVLIYFDQKARQEVCNTIHRLLMDGGYLVLGSAESLYGVEHKFATVKYGRAVVHQKLAGG